MGRRLALALGTSALLVGSIAGPASAADSVTQVVTAGVLTASVADLVLTSTTYSHSVNPITGAMTLTADDSTGSDAGWNVTVQATSDFVYVGPNLGTDIPAAKFSLTAAAVPVKTAGQAADVTGGPKVPAASPVGTLDAARKTVQAELLFGKGTYTQVLDVRLDIPANSAPGTYTGTLTTTISAAP